MIDFTKTIQENRKNLKRPFVVAHRGVSCANVPCNSLAAFKIALNQGCDVIELDVSITKDKKYYVFHPGMEKVFLGIDKLLSELTSDEVDKLFLLNQDKVPTSYKVPILEEVFELLKDKVYINVDKFWTDIEGITNIIYNCHVEKQVIVKTWCDEEYLNGVEKYAPELMFMTLCWHEDTVTEKLLKRKLNYIGVECLFNSDTDEVCQKSYIKKMHENNLLVWGNSIVYNEKEVISNGHTDDLAVTGNEDFVWGYFLEEEFDFIQTDWTLMCKNYLEKAK